MVVNSDWKPGKRSERTNSAARAAEFVRVWDFQVEFG